MTVEGSVICCQLSFNACVADLFSPSIRGCRSRIEPSRAEPRPDQKAKPRRGGLVRRRLWLSSPDAKRSTDRLLRHTWVDGWLYWMDVLVYSSLACICKYICTYVSMYLVHTPRAPSAPTGVPDRCTRYIYVHRIYLWWYTCTCTLLYTATQYVQQCTGSGPVQVFVDTTRGFRSLAGKAADS